MIFVHVRKYFLHVHVHFSKTGEDFVKKNSLVDNEHINRSLEMTPDARTNAGKHITSNIACASSQRYIKDSVSDSDCPKWCCVLWHSISFRPLLDHLKWRLSMHQLMFPQPVWWTIWIDVRSVERREILQCHNFALSFGLIRRVNILWIARFVHMQCLTLRALTHFSELWTSFQAFCWLSILTEICTNAVLPVHHTSRSLVYRGPHTASETFQSDLKHTVSVHYPQPS